MNEVNKTLFIPLYGKALISRMGIILQDKKAEEIWDAEGFALRGKAKSKWLAYNMAIRARIYDDWAATSITVELCQKDRINFEQVVKCLCYVDGILTYH